MHSFKCGIIQALQGSRKSPKSFYQLSMIPELSIDEIIGAGRHASMWCVYFVSHYIIEKRREALQA